MRRLLYIFALLFPLLSHPADLQIEKEFVLKGNISGLKSGAAIYLIQHSSGDTVCKTISKNGRFILRGNVPNGTEYYYIRIDTSLSKKRSSEFLLINAKLSLKGEIRTWPSVRLIGSEPNDEYLAFASIWDGYNTEINRILQLRSDQNALFRIDSVDNSVRGIDSIARQLEIQKQNLVVERLNRTREFIVKHSNSIYVADLIRRVKEFDFSEKKSMYDMLSNTARDSYFGQVLSNDLELAEIRKNIKEGAVVPDFQIINLEGQTISIRDIVGKTEYTLIDFWASWCRPCRKAVPGLKYAYELYRDKGFNIIGIALSDKESDWRKAVLEDSTDWVHGMDKNNISYKIFDIPAIPGYLLLNKRGEIVSFDCSGSVINKFGPPIRNEELLTTLKTLLGTGHQVNNHSTTNNVPVNSARKILEPGDVVPDLFLGEVVNLPGKTSVRISDFKGKLLILDFWSTWCSVCIAQFPKMYELQKKFGENLVILPVGFDVNQEGSIKAFLAKRKNTEREIKLPSAIQKPTDSILFKTFPFSGLPHEIWIDKKGRLIGVTDHKAVTEENIKRILAGEIISFREYKLKKRLKGSESFLLKKDNGFPVAYGAAFYGYIDTLGSNSSSGIYYRKDSFYLAYYGANNPVIEYYKDAYSMIFPELRTDDKNKRVIIQSKSKSQSFYKSWSDIRGMDNWAWDDFCQNHLFAFELILPGSYGLKEAYKYMISQLDQYFRIQSKIERRKTRCLILIKTSKNDKIKVPENSEPEYLLEDGTTNKSKTLRIAGDNNINYLINQLNALVLTPLPIIDNTGYRGNIHLTIENRIQNISTIRASLKKYDLDLIETEKEIPMLVLYNTSR